MSAFQFLLLEANLTDAEVVQATLFEGGINCEILRVETHADFIRTLETEEIDLILADYALSSFDGIAALPIARRLRPEIPFIFISGSLGEELAIEAIKQGATDYVLKQRLGRLVPSVQRALQEAPELDKDTIDRKQAEAALHQTQTELVDRMVELQQATPGDLALAEIVTQSAAVIINSHFEAQERARAEAALRESQARLQSIANLVPDLLWESEPDGSTNWYNQRWMEYTGQTFEQAIGWSWTQWIHPDDKAASVRRYREAVKQGVLLQQEHRIRGHDGEYRWFVVNAFPLKDESGKVIKMYGAATDIHEARIALEALRKSEQKYRSLFDSIDAGFCIFEMLYNDAGEAIDFCYIETNPGFERQSGRRPQPGQTMRELFPEAEDMWLKDYAEVARTGQAKRFIDFHADLDRWFDVFVFPTSNGKNQLAALFSDVTDKKRAEAALRESEEKYAALLAASPVPFMVLEPNPPDFTITAANEAYFAATLTTPEGLIGRRLFDVFTDDPNRPGDHGSEALALSLDRVLTSRRPDAMARTRCDIVTPDGGFEPHWWLAINAPLLNASGEVTAIIHQVTRVTELHLAQEAERKNQERQVFLLQMSDAMRSLADPLEIQETVTRTAMNHFGADRCYYCEIEDGNAIIWRDATREGLPTVAGVYPLSSFAILQAAINSGHPFVVQDVYTTDRVDEDIRQLCIQLQVISFIDVPVIKDGKPVGILCLVQSTPRDWTDLEVELTVETAERTWAAVERAHAEAALRGSEAKYRTLFESINDGFCTIEVIFDQNEKPIDYRFLEISPSFERQTGLADALGKRVRELAPNHEEYWFEIYGNVALSGQSVRFENYARELQRWFEVYAFSVGELEDRQVAVVLSVINDRKQAQANQIQLIREQAAREQERQRAETLAELDRAKTLFFSNVSHEFRTPLTLSLAPLQDALSDSANPLPPAQQERLQLAHSNSLRLLKLVNTLLDFSRIEANRLNANYEPTDLSTYTAELASVFRSAIENANLELVVDCPPLPDPIYVDREMWEKIVLNLLSNALKFTFEGIISVSLQPKANTVELIVSDTGVGISASELPYLFERFYQVKGAKGRSYEGSGIGLFLVQELVKRHGGAIAVTSAVDQGTIFTVTIPTGIAHLPADQIWVASTLASSAVTANAFVEEALHWLPEESTEFQNSEVQAQNSEVHAQNSQVQAQSSEVHAQNSEVHAQNSQVHAQNSEVQAQNSQVHAQNSEVHAQNSQVQAQNSQVQAQNSEVHAQNSEVHAQNSEVQVQNSEVHAPSSKRARILLVDDNADMRGYLKRLLNQYYEVETVNDGLAALTAILRGGSAIYDLVLADVMMPRMDGFELLRSLRASPNTQTIPIILLSARAGEESRVEGLETGADDYLIKPFSARELLARVNANLQLAQLRREAVYREQVMQAVQTLNERLEQQVKARTAQLEAINQELEAFSSSISHDLQIPLRYISSFAEQLQAKLNATLVDASSLQILNIITQSTLQAEKMVDDLLEFSRLGQTKMYLTTVNITQLVQQVREQLQLELVGRSLHWEIEPLLTAKGDSALLRLVLQNLLSNAVKYTHNNSEAAIKIGRIEQEQEVIFFVKDNGAGFDMKYCDQLFSIFQRLHSQEEFPGTGVGLATVRRIIHRHGGRIWAEGAIDQGATFYFSLPKREAQL